MTRRDSTLKSAKICPIKPNHLSSDSLPGILIAKINDIVPINQIAHVMCKLRKRNQ